MAWILHDCAPDRMTGRPWMTLRAWKRPAPDHPLLDAKVVFNRSTERCWFVVYSDLGVYALLPSVFPLPEWGSLHEEYETVAQYVRRAVAAHERRSVRVSQEGEKWVSSHPATWEYLTLETHDDGESRELSMMLVLVEDGRFKVALQDREEGRSLWVTADTLDGALEALETALQDGRGDWRQMKQGPSAKRRK